MHAQPIRFFKSAAEAQAVAGSLSKPSKMPGAGYGLPALISCNVGSKYAKVPGTICSKCYACKGRYTFPTVKNAQMKRLEAVEKPEWVDAMVELISREPSKYFRWHDSGDLISIDHLSKICQIALRLPDYVFWLPTNEHQLVAKYRKTHAIPDNLVIRLSSPKIDGPAVKTDLCTSGVYSKGKPQGHQCPAPAQGGKCGECRACWNKDVKHVSYRAH